MVTSRSAAVVFAVTLCAGRWVGAQEDFRASDPDRPIRVEDAYPIKYLEWEWQLGTRGAALEGGEYEAAALLELKTGFARNWQAGIELHSAFTRIGGVSRTGLEELVLHLLYNPNQEGAAAPAVAVRGDLLIPGAGDVKREALGGQLKGIMTTGFRRLRLHVNAGYAWAGAADGGDFWAGGVALDYPIGLFSKLVLGDLYAEVPTTGGDARFWAEFGTRWQLTNSTVLDLGLTSRLDEWADGRANVGLVVGLSRVFGIPPLVTVPAYPNPKLN